MNLTLLGIVGNTPRATLSLLIPFDTFFQSTEPNPALGRTFYGLVSLQKTSRKFCEWPFQDRAEVKETVPQPEYVRPQTPSMR